MVNFRGEADRCHHRIKIFLFVLLRDMEFSYDPAVEIEKKVKCVPSALYSSRS